MMIDMKESVTTRRREAIERVVAIRVEVPDFSFGAQGSSNIVNRSGFQS